MNKILDFIYNNYYIFIGISIFLILALVGYYVDKKTRKDDIKPMFSMVGRKKDPKAPKVKKDKKSKKEYKSVVIGGDAPIFPAAAQNAQNGANQVSNAPAAAAAPVQTPAPAPVQAATSSNQVPTTPAQSIQAPAGSVSINAAASPVTPAQAPATPAATPAPAAPASAPAQTTNEEDSSPMNFNMTE